MASSVDGALSVAMIPIGRSLRPNGILCVHSTERTPGMSPRSTDECLNEAIKDTDITLLEHLSLHRRKGGPSERSMLISPDCTTPTIAIMSATPPTTRLTEVGSASRRRIPTSPKPSGRSGESSSQDPS